MFAGQNSWTVLHLHRVVMLLRHFENRRTIFAVYSVLLKDLSIPICATLDRYSAVDRYRRCTLSCWLPTGLLINVKGFCLVLGHEILETHILVLNCYTDRIQCHKTQ